MTDLLPPNATPVEQALAAATARIDAIPVPVRQMWDPMTCPASILPWLAWTWNVEEWDELWPEDRKRAVIAAQVDIHRMKGTKGSIIRALEVMGYGRSQVIERDAAHVFDGTLTFDGTETYRAAHEVDEYRVVAERPMTVAQSQRLRSILGRIAPAHMHLRAIDFTEVAHTYDGTITFDGSNNFGVA
ncbi:MAG: phage tail protein I [Pseudomonadota bacterium]